MNRLIFLVIIFFTVSCANIVPPSGGPKDTSSPVLLASAPAMGTLNFKGKKIELLFNEEIDVSNLQGELIIAPLTTDNNYTYTIRKDRLIIEFEKQLQENTTYTFNFGESIKDITEGNKASNIHLSFSTGPEIDTATIRGIVKDLETNLPAQNYLVALYPSADTLNPKNSKPLYFTRTDNNGSFLLRNLKSDKFNIYTFADKNRNLQWNYDEKIGFTNSVSITERSEVNIVTIKYDEVPPKIKNIKYSTDINEINLTEGIKNFSLNDQKVIATLSENGKLIKVYKTQELNDTLKIPIELTDSVGLSNKEEIKIFFSAKEETQVKKNISKKNKKEDLISTINPPALKIKPGKLYLEINFSQPVIGSDLNKITIYSDTVKINYSPDIFKWISYDKLKIESAVKAKDSVVLFIPEKTFISADTFNSEKKYVFTFLQEENFATIKGKINTVKTNYIIQLLNSKYEVKESLYNPSHINMNFIPPGTYYLRVIIDENGNGVWDQGNPFTFISPEPIIYHKNKIELRANWEITDLVFSF
jgi:hypothetical protein